MKYTIAYESIVAQPCSIVKASHSESKNPIGWGLMGFLPCVHHDENTYRKESSLSQYHPMPCESINYSKKVQESPCNCCTVWYNIYIR